MAGTAYLLLDAVTANTEGTSVDLGSGGGDRYVFISGGFGGGTLTLQVASPNKGTWIPISEGVFTEAQAWVLVGVRDNLTIRAVLTGATAPTLTVEISK